MVHKSWQILGLHGVNDVPDLIDHVKVRKLVFSQVNSSDVPSRSI